MRRVWLAALGLALIAPARAQRPSFQAAPLPPLQQQWQQEGSPPVQQSPGSPAVQGQTNPNQAEPPPASTPPATTERANVWLPAGTVKLQALDKVNAQSSVLTIKVGQSATFGSLTIAAKACVVRPTDQPADAAAYLAITDSHPDSPGFDGWMLAAEPSLSMMEHPIYDLRVTGCT
jgi:hypothetical protein